MKNVQWGGGILNRKNPKDLQRFDKNRKLKTIFIGSIIGILLIIGGISLYQTFALYKIEKTFNVLQGTVPDFRTMLLSDYILEKSKSDTSIQTFTHAASSQTTALTDYRYTGANPNNYVCFGSEEKVCPTENLYRIIGVIPTQDNENSSYENRVKLIKATPYTETQSGYLKSNVGYLWSTVNSSDWKLSFLNNRVLNDIYWKSLGDYQQYIASSLWYLGAPNAQKTVDHTMTPELLYLAERSNTKGYGNSTIKYVGNIGLMYTSDYGLAAGISYRNTAIDNHLSTFLSNSWLKNTSGPQWTISPEEVYNLIGVWVVYSSGLVQDRNPSGTNVSYAFVSPTFYLNANVLRRSGNGSATTPYRIIMPNVPNIP